VPRLLRKREKRGKKIFRKGQKRKEIVTISTPNLQIGRLLKTLGMVSHEHIFWSGFGQGVGFSQNLNGGIAISWARRSTAEGILRLNLLKNETIELGGNAVVGVDIVYKVLGAHNDMVMLLVGAKGTAVVVMD